MACELVIWDLEKGNRVQLEFLISPVPRLADI
jgi:hypothetical protein